MKRGAAHFFCSIINVKQKTVCLLSTKNTKMLPTRVSEKLTISMLFSNFFYRLERFWWFLWFWAPKSLMKSMILQRKWDAFHQQGTILVRKCYAFLDYLVLEGSRPCRPVGRCNNRLIWVLRSWQSQFISAYALHIYIYYYYYYYYYY